MTKIKMPSKQSGPPFLKEIMEKGYHLYSLEDAKIAGFYPSKIPNYPGVKIKDLNLGDVIVVKAFFNVISVPFLQSGGGYIDLEVEHIEDDSVMGVILTTLPEGFSLETGDVLEIFEQEILYKEQLTEH